MRVCVCVCVCVCVRARARVKQRAGCACTQSFLFGTVVLYCFCTCDVFQRLGLSLLGCRAFSAGLHMCSSSAHASFEVGIIRREGLGKLILTAG